MRNMETRTLRQVREAVWVMNSAEDFGQVLNAFSAALGVLEIDYWGCGVNVLDTSGSIARVRSYDLRRDGEWVDGEWNDVRPGMGSGTIMEVWQRREVAYRADLIDFPTFRQQMTRLKAQLDALERPQREFDLEDALALVRDQGAQWEVMDRAERRTYIHTVLQRVEIEGEQIRAIQPKREWEPLFLIDRDERFSGVRRMVGPAGFEPTTERL